MLSEVEVYSLSKVKNVGDKTLMRILRLIEDAGASNLLDMDPYIIRNDSILKKSAKEELDKFWSNLTQHLDRSAAFIDQLKDDSVIVLACTDPRYSDYLALCPDAPPLLYCRGNLERLASSHSVAVVGTRDNTATGKRITERTVSWLVENDQAIVSGLALGIDTIAHESCLNNNGHTIAVLVDVSRIHPSSNKSLAERIVEQDGLLIAENAPGITTVPPLFAKRDRIQAGLSTAVFPIETSIDGGTMHAVRSAGLYGRHVFAPDIAKGMYSDPDIAQVQGIKNLIDNQLAIPYDRTKYPEIARFLAAKEQELGQRTADASRVPQQSAMRQSQLI